MIGRIADRAVAVVAAALLALGLFGAPDLRATAETRSIVDYGACTGCAASANRVAIQAAIDAAQPGDTVYIPPGTYYVDKVPTSSPWSLYVTRDDITFAGASRDTSIIALDPTQANADVPFGNHLGVFYLKDVADITFRNFQIEGSKDSPDGPTEYEEPPEHHRGIFVWNSERLLVEDMLIENFTGDALQLYIEANNSTVRRCIFRWNQRDGLTLSPAPDEQLAGVLAEHNEFYGNSNQQIDNEHGAAHDVEVRYNTLAFADNQNSIGLAIAGAGKDSTRPSLRWNIHHNQVSGAIIFVWTSDSIIADNVINNPRRTAAVQLERMQANNQILRNVITQSQVVTDNLAGVYANGTLAGGATNITIEDNRIAVADDKAFGIRLDGVVSAAVRRNLVIGGGVSAPTYSGIRIRATVEARDVESVTIEDNDVRNWGHHGIAFAGTVDTQAKILHANVFGNYLQNSPLLSTKPMTSGITFDNTGALRSLAIRGNVRGCGVTSEVGTLPAGITLVASPLALAAACN